MSLSNSVAEVLPRFNLPEEFNHIAVFRKIYTATDAQEVNTKVQAGLTLAEHPELLDWLACEFRDHPWSVKSLHRLIVTSATYRQVSSVSEQLYDRDPQNRLLARQSRIRLEAEAIRDSSIHSAGVLSTRIGGKGVYPTTHPAKHGKSPDPRLVPAE